jgi:hypothetical protein
MVVYPGGTLFRGTVALRDGFRLPKLVADDPLIYFDQKRHRGSWLIRDFITGRKLDDTHSALRVAVIEGDAERDEFPFRCNARGERNWIRIYLNIRTAAVFCLRSPLSSP